MFGANNKLMNWFFLILKSPRKSTMLQICRWQSRAVANVTRLASCQKSSVSIDSAAPFLECSHCVIDY